MVSNITFKPQISLAPNEIQKSKAVSFESKLLELNNKVLEGKTSDIGVMTEKTALEANLHEANARPVKFVEDRNKTSFMGVGKSESTNSMSDPRMDNTIKAIQNGLKYSHNEQSQILTGQMNQMAVYNQVLHGLV